MSAQQLQRYVSFSFLGVCVAEGGRRGMGGRKLEEKAISPPSASTDAKCTEYCGYMEYRVSLGWFRHKWESRFCQVVDNKLQICKNDADLGLEVNLKEIQKFTLKRKKSTNIESGTSRISRFDITTTQDHRVHLRVTSPEEEAFWLPLLLGWNQKLSKPCISRLKPIPRFPVSLNSATLHKDTFCNNEMRLPHLKILTELLKEREKELLGLEMEDESEMEENQSDGESSFTNHTPTSLAPTQVSGDLESSRTTTPISNHPSPTLSQNYNSDTESSEEDEITVVEVQKMTGESSSSETPDSKERGAQEPLKEGGIKFKCSGKGTPNSNTETSTIVKIHISPLPSNPYCKPAPPPILTTFRSGAVGTMQFAACPTPKTTNSTSPMHSSPHFWPKARIPASPSPPTPPKPAKKVMEFPTSLLDFLPPPRFLLPPSNLAATPRTHFFSENEKGEKVHCALCRRGNSMCGSMESDFDHELSEILQRRRKKDHV